MAYNNTRRGQQNSVTGNSGNVATTASSRGVGVSNSSDLLKSHSIRELRELVGSFETVIMSVLIARLL